MKKFQKIDPLNIQAVQFGVDPEAQSLATLCSKRSDGSTFALPLDLLGTHKNAFFAVKSSNIWIPLNHFDWIVQHNGQLLVVSPGIFQLFFKEI